MSVAITTNTVRNAARGKESHRINRNSRNTPWKYFIILFYITLLLVLGQIYFSNPSKGIKDSKTPIFPVRNRIPSVMKIIPLIARAYGVNFSPNEIYLDAFT